VGEVTILYNNAGITYIGNFLDINHDQIEKTVRINLLSHFWTLKEFLPAMVERKRGHIVTMCSTLGLKGVRTGSAYAASKFGVRGYLGCLESEIRNHPAKPDIKFTTIYPFFVKTPLIRGLKVTYRY
jgi:all-trans-retinol dehydrogenase (NAD+)